MKNTDFRTFSEYMKKEDNTLTASMEDYLEMIYRLSIDKGFTRVHELAEALNVHPPSATRMVQRLGEMGLLLYEKYGVVTLKDEGKKLGKFLLKRHNTISAFLKLLGVREGEILEEVEKVEHTLSNETIRCFEKYISFIKNNPEILDKFNKYKAPKI